LRGPFTFYDEKSAFNHEAAFAIKMLRQYLKTVASYQAQLSDAHAGEFVVEIPPVAPAKQLSTIVITLPLQSRGDGPKRQKFRTVTLAVARQYRLVLASVGVSGPGSSARPLISRSWPWLKSRTRRVRPRWYRS
jgi:hypothetical protein